MPILVTCECGKQFQAKDENAGRRFKCPNCGSEVLVARPEGVSFDAGSPRTSGKAIASLILGIFSFFCLFFTGLPAIILGAIGLSNIGKSQGRLGGKGLAIAGIVTGSIGILCSLLAIPLTIALLLPAVQAAREAAMRAQCVNNLKQIGLALHNYQGATGTLPTASIANAEGKPLLSWRVTLLPYLGEQALYDQFKLDEPWDSPTNSALLSRLPLVYRCPGDTQVPGTPLTRYQVIVGTGSIFEGPGGISFDKITDGTSNTILAVEGANLVEWTKPSDLDISGIVGGLGGPHPNIYNVLFADGSVKGIATTTPPAIVKALATSRGGEVLAPGSY